MRKMATIRRIDGIDPINGADAIEVATVGGWKVVIRKGEFSVGDLAVYCEIDSWIPTNIAPFLSKGKEPRVYYEGVEGARLRTVKLRGQISQGLLLPIGVLPADDQFSGPWTEGDDVSSVLNIQKWEPVYVNSPNSPQIGVNFPTRVPKTDQERCQNLVAEVEHAICVGMKFEITEKLDGSSMTCYLIDGQFGVCSRNLDLNRDENNVYWATAIREDIESKMRAISTGDFAIQGELIGPGIQGNIYKLAIPEFHVFDVYDVSVGDYMRPDKRLDFIENVMELKHVPIIAHAETLSKMVRNMDALLEFAEGKSILNPNQEREGTVFKECNGGMSFKAISNKYLLSEK